MLHRDRHRPRPVGASGHRCCTRFSCSRELPFATTDAACQAPSICYWSNTSLLWRKRRCSGSRLWWHGRTASESQWRATFYPRAHTGKPKPIRQSAVTIRPFISRPTAGGARVHKCAWVWSTPRSWLRCRWDRPTYRSVWPNGYQWRSETFPDVYHEPAHFPSRPAGP